MLIGPDVNFLCMCVYICIICIYYNSVSQLVEIIVVCKLTLYEVWGIEFVDLSSPFQGMEI